MVDLKRVEARLSRYIEISNATLDQAYQYLKGTLSRYGLRVSMPGPHGGHDDSIEANGDLPSDYIQEFRLLFYVENSQLFVELPIMAVLDVIANALNAKRVTPREFDKVYNPVRYLERYQGWEGLTAKTPEQLREYTVSVQKSIKLCNQAIAANPPKNHYQGYWSERDIKALTQYIEGVSKVENDWRRIAG